jgi:hypothetical protein
MIKVSRWRTPLQRVLTLFTSLQTELEENRQGQDKDYTVHCDIYARSDQVHDHHVPAALPPSGVVCFLDAGRLTFGKVLGLKIAEIGMH